MIAERHISQRERFGPERYARKLASNQEQYIAKRQAGLCTACKAEAEPGRCMCRPCAKISRDRHRRRYRLERGLPLDTPPARRGVVPLAC